MTATDWSPIALPTGPRARAKQILWETCERHGVSVEAVCGPRRIHKIMLCRREAVWLIAKHTTLSLTQIGALLSKDHTTILMTVRRQNEISGENVRNTGGVPEKTRERNREACRLRSQIRGELRLAARMRRSELCRTKRQFLAGLTEPGLSEQPHH